MRGLLFGLVLVALASAASCLAEPQDRLLEVSSLVRLHQRVNVHLGAGRKAGSHAPPLTPEAPVHAHDIDDDDHSGSPSASLKSSTSSITLKEPIDIDTKGPQSTYSVIENATPHIHNNINNIVKNHNRNIAAEKRRLLTVGDLGEAEIQAVHSVLDKLFPEEANLEREAKEFELSQLQPIPPAKVAKLPKAPKAEKETKKRHEFSEGSVAYLKKIWLDNKSVAKLRTYYTNRVASAIDQLQQSKDLLFKPELKPTPRKRAATEAFLAFELRHRARLVTRWAQDVSEDTCQIKLVAGARKRDLRTYGSRDGPTFELLVGRKIKSMQKACKKQSKKLKNKNEKKSKNKNKNKNEKKEHKEEQLGPFTDEDFVKLYSSIVSSARRPNRFLNLFLRIKKTKKTEKKPAEHDVDEGLDGKPKLDPASSEPVDTDHADTCTLAEKQGMMELQQIMDSVELELIEDPEEHEVCAFTPAEKHDL